MKSCSIQDQFQNTGFQILVQTWYWKPKKELKLWFTLTGPLSYHHSFSRVYYLTNSVYINVWSSQLLQHSINWNRERIDKAREGKTWLKAILVAWSSWLMTIQYTMVEYWKNVELCCIFQNQPITSIKAKEIIRKIRLYPCWFPSQNQPFLHLISCCDEIQGMKLDQI